LISQNTSVQSDLILLQYRTLPLEETTFGFLTSVTILFRTIKLVQIMSMIFVCVCVCSHSKYQNLYQVSYKKN